MYIFLDYFDFNINNDKISLTRGDSRVNFHNPMKYNLFSTSSKEDTKFMTRPRIQNSIDKRIEKTISVSNLNKKDSFNLKESVKIKNFHLPSRSLNQSNLNHYMSHGMFKSKIDFK